MVIECGLQQYLDLTRTNLVRRYSQHDINLSSCAHDNKTPADRVMKEALR